MRSTSFNKGLYLALHDHCTGFGQFGKIGLLADNQARLSHNLFCYIRRARVVRSDMHYTDKISKYPDWIKYHVSWLVCAPNRIGIVI